MRSATTFRVTSLPPAAWSAAETLLTFAAATLLLQCQRHLAAGASSGSSPQFPWRIPIGAIFDRDSTLSRTAFRYEIEKHNNSSSSTFKIDTYEKDVVILGNFELSKAVCSTMSNGVFALLGVTKMTSPRSIESFASTFNMPYVTPSAPSQTPWMASADRISNAFTLFMRPLYRTAVVDVVRSYGWTKIYYIYNDHAGLSRIEHMNSMLNRDDVSVEIVGLRLRDVDRCHVALRQLDSREIAVDKYIVLDMSTDAALQSVLKQIQNVGMNRANYHYLLGGLAMDELDVEDFRHGGANLTGFRLVNPEFPRAREFQREWSRLNPSTWRGAGAGRKVQLDVALTIDATATMVHGLGAMLLNADSDLFRETFRRGTVYNNGTRGIQCKPDSPVWLHGRAIMKSYKEVEFNGVTGPVAFDDLGQRKNYQLDILEQRLDNDARKIGVWDSKKGIMMARSESAANGTTALETNRTRIVTTIENHPYLIIRKPPDDGSVLTGNDRYEGYCADLAKKICNEYLNVDYEIRLVKDKKFGEKESDGTWNGMVGELTRKEADIAIAPLTISSIRERVIDFSKPFMSLGISIMIKKPEKQKPGVFSFMDPLGYQVWLCIMFSYLAVSTVLFLVSRFSSKEWQIEDSPHGPTFSNDFTILNSLWFSLGAFMRRGCDVCPRSLAGRIVGSAWWFFTLIIISSYTANLAAFLTIERMLTPIESADDLAKQTEILYGTLQAGSTKDFFKTSKIAVYEKMWSFMSTYEPSVFVQTTEEGVQKVRNSKGRYAFLLESTMNEYYNQRKPCNTMKVGENLDSKGYGIATPIGSDLRNRINVAVLQLLEREDLQKLQKKWWYDKGECVVESDKGGSSQSSLSLSNVAGIFYILIGGLGLSMIVASIEYLIKSRSDARRQRMRYLQKTRSLSQCYHDVVDERENGGYAYNTSCGMITMNSCFDVSNAQTQV